MVWLGIQSNHKCLSQRKWGIRGSHATTESD